MLGSPASDLQAAVAELGVASTDALFPEQFADSVTCLPQGPLPFLREDFLRDAAAYTHLPPHLSDAMLAAAPRIEANPAARALIWHAHRMLRDLRKGPSKWPDDIPGLGADAGMFYALALWSLTPSMRQSHQERRIPSDVVRETVCDLHCHFERFARERGAPGLYALYAGGWMTNHFRGELYRVGRFNYMIRGWGKHHVVYRHNTTRRVVALATSGYEYRADGQLNGANGVTETNGLWTATLTVTDRLITGHPIHPAAGQAMQTPIELPVSQWTQVLGPGDELIDIHIPATGPISFEIVGESLRAARNFYAAYFPEKKPRAYWCETWFTDPQLEQYLPDSSNIIRFLREFYIVPCPSDGWAIIRFVFENQIPLGHERSADLDALPRQTTLQRAILDHLKAGKYWRKTGVFLLFEDFDWGSQPYRRGRCMLSEHHNAGRL